MCKFICYKNARFQIYSRHVLTVMYGYYGIKTSRLIPKLLGLVPNFAARFCCNTTQRHFKFCGLSIVGSRRILNNTNLNVCMEHNSKLRFMCLTHEAEVQTIEEDRAVSSTPVKGSGETGPKKSKKKRLKPRAKCRKQNLKTVDCSANLLAELPFVNTETWKDLGFTTSEKIHKKKRKRRESGQRESGEDDVKKKKQSRPNYFVSIAITSPEVRSGIKTVQDRVVQKDHRLAQALIPVGTLHITLLVTHLGSEEEVNTAVCALAQMKQALQDLLRGRGLVLPFTGIGHFKNEVVFVQLAEGEHTGTLTAIAEAVQKAFQERGIASGDCKAFQPHLTFMKLSKAPKLRKQGIRKLDPSLYAEFAEHRFGSEMVSRVDLCSMQKKKTSDGYYHCETSVALDLVQSSPRAAKKSQKRGEEPDDEELVSLSKRLVEDAVLKAVQQYMEETQQGVGGAAAEGPPPAPVGDGVNASASE